MVKHLAIGILCLFLLAACGDAAQPAPRPAGAASAPQPASPPATEPAPTGAPATAEPITPEPATAEPASLPGGDANAAVIAALVAQLEGGPYRVSSITASPAGSFESRGEVVPPNRYHSIATIDGAATEMIIIDRDIWRKLEGGWVKTQFAEGAAGLAAVTTPEAIAASVSAASLVGPDSLDGAPVLVFTYTSTIGAGAAAASSRNTLWASAETGLPLKIEGSTDLGGQAYTTTQSFVYDDSVTVEPPQ
jgi:hypothetical protein